MARIRSYWRTRGLLLGVGGAAVLTIAGIAYASIPDSNGVIHGCYVDAGRGTLRVIDTEVGEAYGIGEVAIQWNQTRARKDLRELRVRWAMKVRGFQSGILVPATFTSVGAHPAARRELHRVSNRSFNNPSLRLDTSVRSVSCQRDRLVQRHGTALRS